MNLKKLHNAITAHFACNKNTLDCTLKLEDSVDAAKAFYHHLQGLDSALFIDLIQKSRYKIKLELIKRYLNEN